MRNKKIKGVDIIFNEYGKWWENDEDIDLVLNNKSSCTFIEIKFQNRKVGSKTFEELKEKSLRTSAKGKFKYIIVSKSGFDEELINRKIQDLILLDLEEITSIIDEESKREKELQTEITEWFNIN